MLIEVIAILALVLANGIFSGAEMAIVASRRGRLRSMADAGDAAARTALDLASNPDRFLPTVQVGVTLVGTLAAAYGGDCVALPVDVDVAVLVAELVGLGVDAGEAVLVRVDELLGGLV